jgi:peptide methionine sulfoxide reductase msrA/msrB
MGQDGKKKLNLEQAIFASGCFWSKEYFFSQVKGVVSTRVGYTGGHTEHPTYKDVCSKTTGHAEAVEVTFDADRTRFEALARLFF